jgi:hypothetical protein
MPVCPQGQKPVRIRCDGTESGGNSAQRSRWCLIHQYAELCRGVPYILKILAEYVQVLERRCGREREAVGGIEDGVVVMDGNPLQVRVLFGRPMSVPCVRTADDLPLILSAT